MPKWDMSGFIAHGLAASPSERANLQAFLPELPAPDTFAAQVPTDEPTFS